MDAETRADLRFKVRRRVSDYIEKSNLPLERTGPGEAEVVCPNCGQTAIVTKLPFEDHYEFWKCPACREEGDAVKYAMHHLRTDNEDDALLDVCRKLGVSVPALATITAKDLMEKEFPPLVELIEGMLAPGLYILAGAPKIGKSWLVLQIAHHISMGIPLWNRKTIKSDVLYLSLEDTERRIQARLLRICDGETGKITFATEAEILGNGFEQQISGYMKAHPETKLIIVDTLIKVRDIGWSNSAYADDYAFMTVFKHLAERFDIAIVLVHHTRKQESQDIMEMISGTNGIMGCADGAMVLERPKRLLPEASLSMTSRDFEDAKILLHQDRETMCWEFAGFEDEQPPEASDPLLMAIAELLSECNSWQGTAAALVDELKRINPRLKLAPNSLSRKLNDHQTDLKECFGIVLDRNRADNNKMISLKLDTSVSDMCDMSDS